MEMVLKKALVIIMASSYKSYDCALQYLNLVRLDVRVKRLCLSALK